LYGSTVIVSLITTPILVARLGVEGFGTLAFVLAVCSLFMLVELGVGEVTIRFLAYHAGRGDSRAVERVLRTTVGLSIAAGAFGWAALFFSAPYVAGFLNQPEAGRQITVNALRVGALIVFLQVAGVAFSMVPAALQRFDIRTWLYLPHSLVQGIGLALLAFLGFGICELLAFLAGTWFLVEILQILVARKLLPGIRLWPAVTRQGLEEVWRFGSCVAFARVFQSVSRQADRLLLAAFVGPAGVALFTVPYQILWRCLEFLRNLSVVLFPRFSSLSELEACRRIYGLATWAFLSLGAVFFVPAVVLLPDFLRLWISEEFAVRCSVTAQVLAVACFLRASLQPTEALLRGRGEGRAVARLAALISLSGLLANAVLIPFLGVPGAAYAFLFASLWGLPAALYAWRRTLRAEGGRELARDLLLPIAAAAFSLLLCLALRGRVGEALGWGSLVAWALLSSALTGVSLLVAEFSVGGRENRVAEILQRLRFILSTKGETLTSPQDTPSEPPVCVGSQIPEKDGTELL